MIEEKKDLPKSAQIVQDALSQKDINFQIVELAASTRTAQQAADTLGCTVSQIAKSLIFKSSQTNRPVLVLTSGSNRVNEKTITQALGESIGKADADFVREVTGFAIGGIPPVGHKQTMVTFIDKDLLQYDELWAAAGTPNTVFKLTPKDLVALTQGTVLSVVD